MKITADLLREIADMPTEAIVATLRLIANQVDAAEVKRGKDRDRKRKSRGSHAEIHVTSADIPRNSADPPPPKERSPIPPKEITPPTTPSLRSGVGAQARKPSPKEILAEVLDEDHASAVVDHRQRLRRALTPRAAVLLAKRFARAADPNAAADEMIVNGWQGFDPEWMENRKGNGNGKRDYVNGSKPEPAHDAIFRALAKQAESGVGGSQRPPGPDVGLFDDRRRTS